jgi:hypothetical protein
MVWNQEWYCTSRSPDLLILEDDILSMLMYLKVIGLLPGLEDGLEPNLVLYLKVTALLLFLEDGLEPRMVLYLKVTGLLPGLEDG